jgi:GntR family transcriptional regulator/MocR family aminotransferase
LVGNPIHFPSLAQTLRVTDPPGVSDVALSKRAAEMGISAMPLSSCYLKPPIKAGLILRYGGTDATQIRDGMRNLRQFV